MANSVGPHSLLQIIGYGIACRSASKPAQIHLIPIFLKKIETPSAHWLEEMLKFTSVEQPLVTEISLALLIQPEPAKQHLTTRMLVLSQLKPRLSVFQGNFARQTGGPTFHSNARKM